MQYLLSLETTLATALILFICRRIYVHNKKISALPAKQKTFQEDVIAELQYIGSRISAVEEKQDDLALVIKKTNQVLFKVQDYQFTAMSCTTNAIEELAECVCNGNKKDALAKCSEANRQIEEARKLYQSYLIER